MNREIKIAWLFPSLDRGFYWQPVLREFCSVFPKSIVFTGLWPGFLPEYQDSFCICICGKTTFIKTKKRKNSYDRYIILPPLSLIKHLRKFKPDVIFTSAFSLWTLFSIFLKIFRKWKVVIIYEGSSPSADMKDSTSRSILRKLLASFSNGLITNTIEGKKYLLQQLHVKEEKVFAKPFEVPEKKILTKDNPTSSFSCFNLKSPIFLYVGQMRRMKGVSLLIKACARLKENGYDNYSLVVVGDGPEKKELEYFAQRKSINENIIFTGWIRYTQLGFYYKNCDVFVFPTLEDTWGMVALEAMLFGKPILCSVYAGAREVIKEGYNGYIFNPLDIEKLTKLMMKFINNRYLIDRMGYRSEQIISSFTPKTAAKNLESVVKNVCL